jgi:hypothetical protein
LTGPLSSSQAPSSATVKKRKIILTTTVLADNPVPGIISVKRWVPELHLMAYPDSPDCRTNVYCSLWHHTLEAAALPPETGDEQVSYSSPWAACFRNRDILTVPETAKGTDNLKPEVFASYGCNEQVPVLALHSVLQQDYPAFVTEQARPLPVDYPVLRQESRQAVFR